MKNGTKHLLLKLLDEKKSSYETSIYSLNISRVKGYEQLIVRHQKKIADLDEVKEEVKACCKGETE